jgi:TRAP-type C4-dicarboxylate transport system substrate-binding protein
MKASYDGRKQIADELAQMKKDFFDGLHPQQIQQLKSIIDATREKNNQAAEQARHTQLEKMRSDKAQIVQHVQKYMPDKDQAQKPAQDKGWSR